MLDVVDGLGVKGRVIDQNLNGVGAPIGDALARNVRQQVGQTSGLGVVVAGFLVGEQQACVGRARLGGFQAEFGIEEDGGSVRRQNARDGGFEFRHHVPRDVFRADALGRGQGFLQAAPLIHRRRRNNAVLVGQLLHVLELTG